MTRIDNRRTISWRISNSIWSMLMYVMPTKTYLSLRYRLIFGAWIDWKKPQAFTEKLQWLKVYGCLPEYSIMVDKVKVKDYISAKIGREYIIPTLSVYARADELILDNLPSKFVLKTNHDSGTAIVCKDKTLFDIESARKTLNRALHRNYYIMGREKPYKSVERRILVESYLEHSGDLVDYKFFCFNGEPRVLKIDYDRETKHHANYYDIDMNLLPFFKKSSRPEAPKEFDRPINYDVMLKLARTLSANIPFVRVDLYNIDGKIYFGEMTFFPSSGFEPLTDEAWDLKLGSWIDLPKIN